MAAYRRYTFARNDLLFTMSDNTRMQTARERDALHARICFTDELARDRKPAFAKSFGGQPSRLEGLACQPKLRSSEGWWSQTESNRRPPACKAGALPTELWPRRAPACQAVARGSSPPSPYSASKTRVNALSELRRGSLLSLSRAKAGGPGKI